MLERAHDGRSLRDARRLEVARSAPRRSGCEQSWHRLAACMRICLVYDCLFPYTVGGAERWYRNLAERLAADGHEVTYLTLRQWDAATTPTCRRRAGRRGRAADGALRAGRQPPDRCRRSCSAPACSGTCCATAAATTSSTPRRSRTSRCSPPGSLRRVRRYRLVVDWHEVWTREYWREYLGRARRRDRRRRAGGCACACRQRAFCFSRLHADGCARAAARRRDGARGRVRRRRSTPPDAAARPSRLAVFAGRHIPEKRAPALVPAIAAGRAAASRSCAARSSATARSAPRCWRRSPRTGSTASWSRPGSSTPPRSTRRCAARSAWCCRRAARATAWSSSRRRRAARRASSCAAPDNAAAELVEDGVNGVRRRVGERRGPGRRDRAGARARARRCARRTARLVRAQRRRLSLDASLDTVVASYARALVARERRRPRRASHVKRRGARCGPAARAARARRAVAQQPARCAAAIAAGSAGSNSSAASPATSGSDARSEHATGTPRAIASSTGSPKPSYSDGNTNAAASANRPSTSASLVQPRKRTSSSTPSVRASLAQLVLVRRRVAGQHERPAAARAGSAPARRAGRARFLCGRLADSAEQRPGGRRASRRARSRRVGVGAGDRRAAERRAARRRSCAGSARCSARTRSSRVALESRRSRGASGAPRAARARACRAPRTPKWASGTIR